MSRKNKSMKLLAALLAFAMLLCSFPAVYSEEDTDTAPAGDVTLGPENGGENVTDPGAVNPDGPEEKNIPTS